MECRDTYREREDLKRQKTAGRSDKEREKEYAHRDKASTDPFEG